MRKSLIAIPIIAISIIAAVAITMPWNQDLSPVQKPMDDVVSPATDLSGIIDIGILIPLTGDLASHGEEERSAALLAIDDFNEYLMEKGANWNLNGIVDDTETKPVTSLDKFTAFHAKGINVVVGPGSSASVRNSLGYITANNMIAISPSSTAPALAIADDNLFRTVPDDNNQGPAISNLMVSQGIKVAIPVWRADAWGDGLQKATEISFTGAGGVMDQGIRYNPEIPTFGSSVSILTKTVQQYADEYGSDKVGILLISFAEVLPIMQEASQYPILNDVKWFGSDANTNESRLIDDPVGLQFATATDFTTVQFAPSDNPITERVKKSLKAELGRIPSVYAYSTYDAVWLAGLAMEAAQSTDTDMIKEQLIPVSEIYTGAVGPTLLNPEGDLAASDYAIWTIQDKEWIVLDS